MNNVHHTLVLLLLLFEFPGGRLNSAALAMRMCETSVRGCLVDVDAAIAAEGLEKLFAGEPDWQKASGAANAHFLGVRNVVLAVDSFSVECRIPDKIEPDRRRFWFRMGFGPAFKATVFVDAFGIIRHWRAGDGYSRSDSYELRHTKIGAEALRLHRIDTVYLDPDHVIIGDSAYPIASRVVTRFPQLHAGGGEATPKQRMCFTLALDAARQVVERTIRHLDQFAGLARSRGHSRTPDNCLRHLRLGIFLYNFHRWSQLRDGNERFVHTLEKRIIAGLHCELVRLPHGQVRREARGRAGRRSSSAPAAAASASSASGSPAADDSDDDGAGAGVYDGDDEELDEAASSPASAAASESSAASPVSDTAKLDLLTSATQVSRAGNATRDTLCGAVTPAMQGRMSVLNGKARWTDALVEGAGFPLADADDELSNVSATFMQGEDSSDEELEDSLAESAHADSVVSYSSLDEEYAAAIVASSAAARRGRSSAGMRG